MTSNAQRAEALGRMAAREGMSLSANPYRRDQRVERARWARGHAAATAEQQPDDRLAS